MACLINPISQPSLNISPISAMRVPTDRDQYDVTGFYKVLLQVFSFYSTVGASGRLKMVSQIL
jgi:hypothetical protein